MDLFWILSGLGVFCFLFMAGVGVAQWLTPQEPVIYLPPNKIILMRREKVEKLVRQWYGLSSASIGSDDFDRLIDFLHKEINA